MDEQTDSKGALTGESGPAEGRVEGFIAPQLPEGEYVAQVHSHRTAEVFGTPKVCLTFDIVTPTDYGGYRVEGWYRLKSLRGNKRKQFTVGPSSDLYRELCVLHDRRLRPDQISLRGLRHVFLRIRLRTVVRDHQQNRLARPVQYSVVDAMLGLEAGSL